MYRLFLFDLIRVFGNLSECYQKYLKPSIADKLENDIPDCDCDCFRFLEFEEFCQLSAKFLIEEDEEGMKRELKEAFRIYDKAGILKF